ncbi:MAG: hypothetical protein SVV03_01250 [Candidatus Nanohaloarchaea archaeon]|nr:hypothetical protein [Candidatus Nanohaloarchaea archaeon]
MGERENMLGITALDDGFEIREPNCGAQLEHEQCGGSSAVGGRDSVLKKIQYREAGRHYIIYEKKLGDEQPPDRKKERGLEVLRPGATEKEARDKCRRYIKEEIAQTLQE